MESLFVETYHIFWWFWYDRKKFFIISRQKESIKSIYKTIFILFIFYFFVTYDHLVYFKHVEWTYILILLFLGFLCFRYRNLNLLSKLLPLILLVFWKITFNRWNFFWTSDTLQNEEIILNRFKFLFKRDETHIITYDEYKNVIFTFAEALSTTFFLIILGIIYWKPIFLNFKKIQRHPFESIFFITFCFVIRWLFISENIFFSKMTPLYHSTNQNIIDNSIKISSKINKIIVILNMILLTPIWEELIFRRALFSIFKRKSFINGILLSSIIFGIAHWRPEDFNNLTKGLMETFKEKRLFNYIFYGFQYSLIYCFFKYKLIYSIVFHSYWNVSLIIIKITALF